MIFIHEYWSKEGERRFKEASLLPSGGSFLSIKVE
jgi:hypothetical protein